MEFGFLATLAFSLGVLKKNFVLNENKTKQTELDDETVVSLWSCFIAESNSFIIHEFSNIDPVIKLN